MTASATWTDAQVKQLRKMWADGFSTSQIAVAVGVKSSNAVIGKISRLGLSGMGGLVVRREKRVVKKVTPRPVAKAAHAPKIVVAIEPPPVVTLPVAIIDDAPVGPVAFMDLRPGMCRWAFGERSFTFCGCRATRSSYCAEHGARVYARAAADETAEAA